MVRSITTTLAIILSLSLLSFFVVAQSTGTPLFFTFNDSSPPRVFDPFPAGNPTLANVSLTIAVNATDLFGVSAVYANITRPGGSLLLLNMSQAFGNRYNVSFSPFEEGVHQVRFLALDVNNNINNSVIISFVIDATAPILTNSDVQPRARAFTQNFTITTGASDVIGNVSSVNANISYPNGTSFLVPLLFNGSVFTSKFAAPNLTGVYNVSFVANDTVGNTATVSGPSLTVGTPLNWVVNVVGTNLSGLPSNLSIYFDDFVVELDSQVTGLFVEDIADLFYDLEFRALDGSIVVYLYRVNVASNNNQTLGLSRNASSPDGLVVYGVLNDVFNFSVSTVTVSYANVSYTNENLLEVHACDDYNFTAQVCNTAFVQISAIQDLVADTFRFNRTSFSAFAIVEPAAPAGGGGGGGGGGTSRVCNENWVCSAYGSCQGGVQTRVCTDENACGTTYFRPPQIRGCDQPAVCVPQVVCEPWTACIAGEQTRRCDDLNRCSSRYSTIETQSCTPDCTPDWQCSVWSACADGAQSRVCVDLNSCSDVTAPVMSRDCDQEPAPITTGPQDWFYIALAITVLLCLVAQRHWSRLAKGLASMLVAIAALLLVFEMMVSLVTGIPVVVLRILLAIATLFFFVYVLVGAWLGMSDEGRSKGHWRRLNHNLEKAWNVRKKKRGQKRRRK